MKAHDSTASSIYLTMIGAGGGLLYVALLGFFNSRYSSVRMNAREAIRGESGIFRLTAASTWVLYRGRHLFLALGGTLVALGLTLLLVA